MTSAEEDERSPTTWKLVGCENGLRFFREIPQKPPSWLSTLWHKQVSVVKSIGVVDAPADRVCSLLLDYGPTRLMWDMTLESAHVLEAKDGKTDVLQLALRLPAGQGWLGRSKFLLLLRWWTKHLDGSYVIFFKSLPVQSLQQKCSSACSSGAPVSWLDCGAYVVRPLTSPSPAAEGALAVPRTQCVVELALESQDPSCSLCCSVLFRGCCSGSPGFGDGDSLALHPREPASCCCCGGRGQKLQLRNALLHSVAGLREFCSATNGGETVTFPPHDTEAPPTMSRGEPATTTGLSDAPALDQHSRLALPRERHHRLGHGLTMAMGVGRSSSAPDCVGGAPEEEGLRVPLLRKVESEEQFEECTGESLSDHQSEVPDFATALRSPSADPPLTSAELRAPGSHEAEAAPAPSPSPAADPVDWVKFHGTVRRSFPGESQADCRNSFTTPDDTPFLVRGESFYSDGAKAAAAGPPLCDLVAVDWFHDREPMGALAQRRGGLVQRVREHYGGRAPFFIVINLQVPGGSKRHYSLAFYFAVPQSKTSEVLRPGSPLHRLTHSDDDDDAFRRERLTLIPAVPQGSWIIRNAVGSARFVMLAQVLETRFVRGDGFFEIDVNMGTSSVVSSILGLVMPCMSILTVDMAFLLKAEEGDDLPEQIFGAVRCCNLEQGSAVPPPPL